MKKEQVEQYISPNEPKEDINKYLRSLYPLIGRLIVKFNTLDYELTILLCELLNDRSHHFGLIIIHKYTFSNKAELFRTMEIGLFLDINNNIPLRKKILIDIEKLFKEINVNLKKSSEARNKIVHNIWEETDDDLNTLSKFALDKDGFALYNYSKFDKDEINNTIKLIEKTTKLIDKYYEKRCNI